MTDSVPVRVPVDFGKNLTEIVQLAPAAKLVPQLLVSSKAPVTPIFVMLSVPLLPLVRVTV